MKIVIDLTSLADNFSGIERYALNISKEIIKEDKKNEYILLFKNSIHPSFKDFIDKNNVGAKILYGKCRVFFSQIKLTKALYKIKADKYIFLAFPSPILFRGKGIINTIHDLTPWDYPKTMKILPRLYFKFSIINAIRVSESILTVSKFSLKRIIQKFNKDNVSIIYNGISEVFIENEKTFSNKKMEVIRKKYLLPEKYLMCLCTLEPRKNIELLVKAFIELKQNQKIDEKLVLVGRRGWKIEKLIEEVNHRYKDDIIITGFVDDIDLPYIYRMADCFIFPSLYEGFGIPVIEAMYMRVPVICSNTSALPEVVDGTGILFENNNKEDLRNKLLYYLNGSTYKGISIERAYERAKHFKWGNEAQKLIKLINRN